MSAPDTASSGAKLEPPAPAYGSMARLLATALPEAKPATSRKTDPEGNQVAESGKTPAQQPAPAETTASKPNTSTSMPPPHHSLTPSMSLGGHSHMRKRYVVHFPPDHLFGLVDTSDSSSEFSESDSEGAYTDTTDDASDDVSGDESGSSSGASSESDASEEDPAQARQDRVRDLWRPRVPLQRLAFPPFQPLQEDVTTGSFAPIATPIGLVEAAADASAAALAVSDMSPDDPGIDEAAAEATEAAQAVAAEEAHEASLEHELSTGRSSMAVYASLGLPDTIDIFLPGQAAWGEYKAERATALAIQAQLSVHLEQMQQMAKLGLSAKNMPPLPSGETYSSKVFEGAINRPPSAMGVEESAAPAPASSYVPRWLSGSWTHSSTPIPDSASARSVEEQQAQPGAMSFLQRIGGAAKKASLSLASRGADFAYDRDKDKESTRPQELGSDATSAEHKAASGSMLHALGFWSSTGNGADQARPAPPAPSGAPSPARSHAPTPAPTPQLGPTRPGWQALGAGFGYDVPPTPSAGPIADGRTMPPPATLAPPRMYPVPVSPKLSPTFRLGSSSSVHAPKSLVPRSPRHAHAEASTQPTSPARAPSVSFTFNPPPNAPRIALPGNDAEEQGREKRFRSIDEGRPDPKLYPASPAPFCPPSPAPITGERLPSDSGAPAGPAPAPPEPAPPAASEGTSVADAVHAVAWTARAGLARLLGPMPGMEPSRPDTKRKSPPPTPPPAPVEKKPELTRPSFPLDPVAQAVREVQAENIDDDAVMMEKIVARLDESLDVWARRILQRVEEERVGAARNIRGRAVAEHPFSHPSAGPHDLPVAQAHAYALSSPPPGSVSDVDEDGLARIEHDVRETFSSYIPGLPKLGARDAERAKKQEKEHKGDVADAQGELDFDYVEETLQAKVRELQEQVLAMVADGFKHATLSSKEPRNVEVDMSTEEIGALADRLDSRVREALDGAQVEMLRIMAQPSPAVMSMLGDTEAAIRAHSSSFAATHRAVDNLMRMMPGSFDAATEALADASKRVAEQVQTSIVGALQPQLEALRSHTDHVDGEVLAARVMTALVPVLEGRHDTLPDQIAESVAGHLRADLRSQVQLQMQAHLRAQIQDADEAREQALSRLSLPPPAAFVPPSSVDSSVSSLQRHHASDSFDTTTVATTVQATPEAEDKSLTSESLADLAKVLAAELRTKGGLSLDPVVDRLDPLVGAQERTWRMGKDLLMQQGELSSTLRALPASLAAKTEVFLTATKQTHDNQNLILERLMHVADANHAAQVRISELEETAAKRADALGEAAKAQTKTVVEVKELKAELDATNKYVSTLKEEVDDLENRLETAQANATAATEQLRDAHSRLRDAVEARHTAERSWDEIRRRMVMAEAELSRAQSAASLAGARVEDMRSTLEREREERTQERTTAQNEADNLRSQVERASKEAEEAHSRLDVYVDDAQRARSGAAMEVGKAQSETAEAKGALTVAQARAKEMDNQVQGLVRALATQKQLAASAQQRLGQATEKMAHTNELERELDTFKTHNEHLEGENKRLEEQLAAAIEETAALRKSLDRKPSTAAVTHGEADALRAERDEARTEIEVLRAQLDAQLGAQLEAQLVQAEATAAVAARATKEVKSDKSEASEEDAFAQPLETMYDWSTTAGVYQNDEGWWN